MIHDFAGPYTISHDYFAFGYTHKYVQLKIDEESFSKYDSHVNSANQTYMERMHNLFCDNCHSHVACALNNMKYQGREDWTMVSVWWLMITDGKYVSCGTLFMSYLGFLIVLAIIAAIVVLTKLN